MQELLNFEWYNTLVVKNNKLKKIFDEVKSLNPYEKAEVRNKLIPIFLDIENLEPYHDKNVIKMLRIRYRQALKEHTSGKLIDAKRYLRKIIG